LKSRDVRLALFEKRLREFLPEIQSFPSSQGNTPIVKKSNGNNHFNVLLFSGKEQLTPFNHPLGDVSTKEQQPGGVRFISSAEDESV
jgi:hypothetical protein